MLESEESFAEGEEVLGDIGNAADRSIPELLVNRKLLSGFILFLGFFRLF